MIPRFLACESGCRILLREMLIQRTVEFSKTKGTFADQVSVVAKRHTSCHFRSF
jgi:hypothetical protein